jgi:hypothetical protein
MILLTAEATPRTRPACGAAAFIAIALLTPALAAAESAGKPQVASRDEHTSVQSARAESRLKLSYPLRVAGSVGYRREAPSLHLELRVYDRAERPPSSVPPGDAFRRALSEWAEPRPPLLSPFWNELADGPPKVAGTQSRLATSEDERSWWARWNSSIWGVSASFGALMFGMVAALSLLPRDISGWNKPNFYGLKRTFTSGPSFDYDHYYFNYLAHPYDGSEFYLAARNRELTWWQSFLYSAAVSSTFEFVIESAYEGASWQDLWITPVSGAVLGELRWQAKKALENPGTGKPEGTANQILYVVVDPLDAIFNL